MHGVVSGQNVAICSSHGSLVHADGLQLSVPWTETVEQLSCSLGPLGPIGPMLKFLPLQ
jgi:hypothetical protein